MPTKKRKFGWTPLGIVGWVFAPIGLFFSLLGFMMYHFGVGDEPDDPLIFLCVFGGMGAIFLILGLGFLCSDLSRRAGQKRVLEEGYFVDATFVGVQVNLNINVNGRHPYNVECHWKDPSTGIMHVFFSGPLYFDPTDALTGTTIPVYLDRMGGKAYYVDIYSVLPEVMLHT
ncbi:MAG: hypothetical protein IJ083_17955 [Clostridia bacterium]|nr:hypothetical protein [Clostridia bacterium]